MSWLERFVMDARLSFVSSCLHDDAPMTVLCLRHGISRKTGYKWLSRHLESGMIGWVDRSRARHTQEHATSDRIKALILETRDAHPTWGAKKLVPFLTRRYPKVDR